MASHGIGDEIGWEELRSYATGNYNLAIDRRLALVAMHQALAADCIHPHKMFADFLVVGRRYNTCLVTLVLPKENPEIVYRQETRIEYLGALHRDVLESHVSQGPGQKLYRDVPRFAAQPSGIGGVFDTRRLPWYLASTRKMMWLLESFGLLLV